MHIDIPHALNDIRMHLIMSQKYIHTKARTVNNNLVMMPPFSWSYEKCSSADAAPLSGAHARVVAIDEQYSQE